MEETKEKGKSRAILTIILGLCIVFARVIMPTHVEITTNIVIIECVLELCICIGVVLINFDKLKALFKEKCNLNTFITKSLYIYIFVGVGTIIAQLLLNVVYNLITGMNAADIYDPAALVANKFQETFAPGVILTTCIIAPITEEIAFRMAFRDLIKNDILYVIVSSWLFGFIHTANLFVVSILFYAITGVLFCIVYMKTKDVRKQIVAHMLYNIIATINSIFR